MSKALKSGGGLAASVRRAVNGLKRAEKPEEEDEAVRAAETDEDEDEAKSESDDDEKTSRAESDDDDKAEGEDDETESRAETDDEDEVSASEDDEEKDGKAASVRSRTKAAFALMRSADAKGREKLASELAEDVAAGTLSAARAADLLKSAPKASRLSESMSGRDVDPGSDSGVSANPGGGLAAAVKRRYGPAEAGR